MGIVNLRSLTERVAELNAGFPPLPPSRPGRPPCPKKAERDQKHHERKMKALAIHERRVMAEERRVAQADELLDELRSIRELLSTLILVHGAGVAADVAKKLTERHDPP